MIRVNISQGSNSFGSLFVGDGTVELHTANRDRFLEALALAYTALTGRDCARTLTGGTVTNAAKTLANATPCPGCEAGTLDGHIYGHGENAAECSLAGRSAVLGEKQCQ